MTWQKMSNIKWFLLIASLALGPEVSSRGLLPTVDQQDGVYCKYICSYRWWSGSAALCVVMFENSISLMVGRKPRYSSWQFSPLNTRDKNSIMSDPDSLCERIGKADNFDGKTRCYPIIEKRKSDYFENAGDEKSSSTPSDHSKSDDLTSFNNIKDLIAKLDEAIDSVKQAYISSVKRSHSVTTSKTMKDVEEIITTAEEIKEVVKTLTPIEEDPSPVRVKINYDALPEDIGSYTPEEWNNMTEILTKTRDDAERDEQPDLKELVPALDKALPVLDSIIIVSSEDEPKRKKLRFFKSLVDIIDSIIGAGVNVTHKHIRPKKPTIIEANLEFKPGNPIPTFNVTNYGRPRKEEQEVMADDLKLKMKKVKEEAANLGKEIPKELIDDLDKKVEKLSSAIDSPEKAKKRCATALNTIKDLMGLITPGSSPSIPAIPVDVNGGKYSVVPTYISGGNLVAPGHTSGIYPVASSIKKQGEIDIYQSNEVCEGARQNLCERQDIMIYTSDDNFCMGSLKFNFICNHNSGDCLQDLDYILESVQWY